MRVKDREIVVMPTDKSGRLSVNTRDNYMELMNTHVQEDAVITLEQQRQLERECNGHTAQWRRIICLGDKWNGSGQHLARVGSALRTRNSMVPPMYGLPKDHKPLTPGREDLGHPLRPVCGATECINGPLSNLLTEILTVVGDMADVDVQNALSTEEVMEALTELNTRSHTFRRLVVMSMDVDSMFPRLNREKVASIVAEEFLRSGLKVEVDPVELGLYLAVAYQDR